MDVLLTLLRLCCRVCVCAYSPETGGLSTVKIAKESDKEESRKVRACEGGGRGRGARRGGEEGEGGELGEVRRGGKGGDLGEVGRRGEGS